MSYRCRVLLENGLFLEGSSPYRCRGVGEAVFNTAMAGYQEILTDPSYSGQCVIMTYPLIGNYGTNEQDIESDKIQVSALLVRRLSLTSGHQNHKGLINYLKEKEIPLVEKLATRQLTLSIRSEGAMRIAITTDDVTQSQLRTMIEECPPMKNDGRVHLVTTKEKYVVPAQEERKFIVSIIDCGMKSNIKRILSQAGCELHVFPAHATAEQLCEPNPDGIFISNGPGDPAPLQDIISTIKSLIGKLPLFGICLGHQLLCLALGAKTYKLKFGHRGANHPILNLGTGKICVTSQNHGFCVSEESLQENEIRITHRNLNDQTCAGFQHRELPISGVQFHPEASPGPQESKEVFDNFFQMMRDNHA